MLIALPFHPGDEDQAIKLMEWLIELGPHTGHSLLLIYDKNCKRVEQIKIAAGQAKFDAISTLPVTDDAWNKWPQSPNLMFRRTAKYIDHAMPQPWFWLEPDAIPLRKGWADEIAAEYAVAVKNDKLFLGAYVNVPSVPPHMSGVAVYPAQLARHGGNMLLADEVAFDVVGADQVLPRLQVSKLIYHKWKPEPFTSLEALKTTVLDTGAAIYHQDKTGAVIDLLQPAPQTKGGADILIKTYPYDYEWLGYCLRSIEKFASGFTKLVIIYPEGCMPPDIGMVKRMPVMLIPVAENGDPYLFQQAVKINAHEFTDADYILHIDSDTVFTQPAAPETFMANNKPLWFITPYTELERALQEIKRANPAAKDWQCADIWRPFTEKFLGDKVEYEFMRRFPMLIPRTLHLAASAFCMVKHGMRLTDYVLSQPNGEFSEFNALGALAYARAQNDFHWFDTTKEALPALVAIQHWSHDKLTDEKRAELDALLTDEIIATKEGIWVLKNDSHISRWVEEHGKLQHDGQTLPKILDLIKPGDVVVDVGAFIGDTTGPFLERVGPTGIVFAFEPNPDACECLRRNCWAATVYNIALSDDDGDAALITDPNAGASYVTAGNGIITEHLDNFKLHRLNLLKIDAEGYELRVLKGAAETIWRCQPLMVIEINRGALERQGTTAEEVFDWLKDHGYEYEYLIPVEGVPPQCDILCRPLAIWGNRIEGGREAIGFFYEKFPVSPESAELHDQNPHGIVVPMDSVTHGEHPTTVISAALSVPAVPINTESREVLVRDTVALLKKFCTSPRHTGLVRKELKAQKVIK